MNTLQNKVLIMNYCFQAIITTIIVIFFIERIETTRATLSVSLQWNPF